MSIISTTIPNLVNGVSQQPYALRLASQAEEQINGYSSVVEGLRKRPMSRLSARFRTTPLSNCFTHTINRDGTERYQVIVTNGNLQVYKLDGTPVTVNFPNGTGYLVSTNADEDFAAVTVADYTFVANKTITVVANTADLVPTRPFEALFWIKQGAYSANYTITVGTTTVTHTTADATSAAQAIYIKTDYIAGQLVSLLNAAGLAAAGYTIYQVGSLVYVSRATEWAAASADSIGDQGVKLIKNTSQRFSDLPAKGVPSFRIKVAGTSGSSSDDYFVQFDADAGNPYGGVWKECAAGGESKSYTAASMPHILIREANGTFTFKEATWADRKVGNLDRVPQPSFVDRKINDVFFHRNRLGFLADENVVFSRSGEFFNFYPSSAIQALDTDPIDIAVSHVKVSTLHHAIPYNESLLLFSAQTQFTLGKTELLTPRTVSLNQTTEFECSLRAKPVGAGSNVYFALGRGQFAAVREYYVDGDTKTNDATDVTAHCPKYIPKGIVKLAASSNEDVLVALSENAPNSLFVYRYYYNKAEKLQSSWSRWDFSPNDTILSCDFIESDLWLVISRPDGCYIEVMSLEPGRVDTGETFSCHLDRRFDHSQVTGLSYNATTDKTTFTMPWAPIAGDTVQLIAWSGDTTQLYKIGEVVPYTRVASVVTVPGKLTKFFMGLRYAFRYRFSTLVVREQSQGGGGLQPIGDGRVQLRKMTMTYSGTGYFRVQVTPKYRDPYSYVFSGRVVGSAQNKIGKVSIEEGVFPFPVAAKNDQVTIEVINDTHLPCAFLSAEWEAFFSIRSKRL